MKAERLWIAALCAAIGGAGCESSSSSGGVKHASPAKVMQVTDESNLATVVLTPEAEKRLGIVTVPVECRKVPRQRTFSGEVVVPPGRSITVCAPLGGTIKRPEPESGGVPAPGSPVKKGQAIFAFLPLLSPERSVLTPSERVRLAEAKASLAASRVEAQGRVESAKVEVAAAEIELRRAEQLLRDKFGTQRDVDSAKARLDLGRKQLEAAEAREALLAKTILDAEAGTLTLQTLASPQDGVLQDLYVAAGQTVAPGAALFEVVDQDVVWIRVPVYVGDLERLDTASEARVGGLASRPGAPLLAARSVPAPPSANPNAATVDLFYEMNNNEGRFRPGQRVAVSLTLKDEKDSLVAPWAAVLYDIHGGAWVYQKTGDHTYSRRRVQVRHVAGPLAVLASGPEPGTPIVTDGAPELFGTEFGNAK